MYCDHRSKNTMPQYIDPEYGDGQEKSDDEDIDENGEIAV